MLLRGGAGGVVTRRMFLLARQQWQTVAVGQPLRVVGPEGRHAVSVVRIQVGDEVLVGDGEGRQAVVAVTQVGREEFTGQVLDVHADPAPSLRFVLVQALAKGQRDEQAVEAATELGVDEVVPWEAGRSIVQWRGEKEERGRARWQSVVTAAAKQARRGRVPVVGPLVRRDAVGKLVRNAALALVLHEDAAQPLAGVPLPSVGQVLLVVGPEGGISPEELAALGQAGALAVRLGPEVLRSSTAGPAALAVLSAAARWR